MYSTHNKGKSVSERLIRTIKNKIYKYKTSISKNVYTNKLYSIVNKYNHIYDATTEMKPADVKSSTYIDFDKNNNKNDPKLQVDDHVRI